jgi:hypothetical protein
MKKNKRRQRRQQATPLTREELKRLNLRRPLWSEEAASAFELAGWLQAVESSDTAQFVGTVEWPPTRARKLSAEIVACEQFALKAAVRTDPSLQRHKNACAFVEKRFEDRGEPVPDVGQLNRWIIWPVIGKTKRGKHAPRK